MADVTISSLPLGTPTSGNVLPYSTGSVTLGTPVSALFHNAGNMGIGTATPQAKLDVNGDVRATGYKTGSLPMFGANAFVHFHGAQDVNGNASTDNTARRIYAGGNVSSVLRNTTGLYTIYFNTAMTTTEYLAVCSARHNDGVTFDVHCEVSNRLTTSCVVNVQGNFAGSPGATAYDSRNVDVMIIC